MTTAKNIQWATDATFAAGALPWSSTATKTEPSGQFKAEGFKPEKPIPANVLNWLLNQYGSEITRLSDLVDVPSFSLALTQSLAISGVVYNFARKEFATYGDHFFLSNEGLLFTGPTASGAGGNTARGAAANEGQYIFLNGGFSIAIFDFNAPTVTLPFVHDVSGTFSVSYGDMVYDQTNNKIVYIGFATNSGGEYVQSIGTRDPTPGGFDYDFSTTVVASAFTASKFNMALCTNNMGLVIAPHNGDNNVTNVVYTTDAGTTWHGGITMTHAFTPAYMDLRCSVDGSEFVYSVANGAHNASEVWTSPDGQTWTKRSSLTQVGIVKIVQYNNGWLATARYPSGGGTVLIFSVDQGVTWNRMPGNFSPSDNLMAAGNYLWIAQQGGNLFRSQPIVDYPFQLVT